MQASQVNQRTQACMCLSISHADSVLPAATIPMLYNATAFIKTGTSNGPSPVPSCCPSLMSEVATAGRRLKQASVTDG